jgi:hypothetical protein
LLEEFVLMGIQTMDVVRKSGCGAEHKPLSSKATTMMKHPDLAGQQEVYLVSSQRGYQR